MLLTPELAGEIVRETMARVGRNINMMDEAGIIIASGEPSRIGQYHAAAAEAIRRNESFVIDEAQAAARYPGAQMGFNVPIQHRDRTIGAIGITGRPQEVEPLGQLLKMTTELMIRQNELKRTYEQRQQEADWIVEALTRGPEGAPEAESIAVRQRLEALCGRWDPPYRAAIVSCPFPEAGGSGGAAWSRERLSAGMTDAMGGSQALLGRDRPQRWVLLLGQADRDAATRAIRRLADWLRSERVRFRIALGNPSASLAHVRISFEEADLALRHADMKSDDPIVYFDEIEARALANLLPLEHGLRLWRKLAPVWQDRMTDTVAHFCSANLSIAGAAASLGIHRNTMLYRLDQIATLTGYDPRRFEHAMLLRIALWQRQRAEADRPTPRSR